MLLLSLSGKVSLSLLLTDQGDKVRRCLLLSASDSVSALMILLLLVVLVDVCPKLRLCQGLVLSNWTAS